MVMLVKILGAVDLAYSLAFLMLTFGMQVPTQYLVFCAMLLLLKGLFIFTGEFALSSIDILSALILLLSLVLTLPAILLWIPSFLLLAKGFVSFM